MWQKRCSAKVFRDKSNIGRCRGTAADLTAGDSRHFKSRLRIRYRDFGNKADQSDIVASPSSLGKPLTMEVTSFLTSQAALIYI